MTRIIKNPGRGYSGKEKMKLYQYSSEGKFLKTWDSTQELRNEYFIKDIGKRPLFGSKKWNKFKYDVLPDNTFYCDYRIGRDKLLAFEKISNSKLCFNTTKNNKEVEMYNLINEKIANFKNMFVASIITKEPLANIFRACNNGKQQTQKDYYFKYKNETRN